MLFLEKIKKAFLLGPTRVNDGVAYRDLFINKTPVFVDKFENLPYRNLNLHHSELSLLKILSKKNNVNFLIVPITDGVFHILLIWKELPIGSFDSGLTIIDHNNYYVNKEIEQKNFDLFNKWFIDSDFSFYHSGQVDEVFSPLLLLMNIDLKKRLTFHPSLIKYLIFFSYEKMEFYFKQYFSHEHFDLLIYEAFLLIIENNKFEILSQLLKIDEPVKKRPMLTLDFDKNLFNYIKSCSQIEFEQLINFIFYRFEVNCMPNSFYLFSFNQKFLYKFILYAINNSFGKNHFNKNNNETFLLERVKKLKFDVLNNYSQNLIISIILSKLINFDVLYQIFDHDLVNQLYLNGVKNIIKKDKLNKKQFKYLFGKKNDVVFNTLLNKLKFKYNLFSFFEPDFFEFELGSVYSQEQFKKIVNNVDLLPIKYAQLISHLISEQILLQEQSVPLSVNFLEQIKFIPFFFVHKIVNNRNERNDAVIINIETVKYHVSDNFSDLENFLTLDSINFSEQKIYLTYLLNFNQKFTDLIALIPEQNLKNYLYLAFFFRKSYFELKKFKNQDLINSITNSFVEILSFGKYKNLINKNLSNYSFILPKKFLKMIDSDLNQISKIDFIKLLNYDNFSVSIYSEVLLKEQMPNEWNDNVKIQENYLLYLFNQLKLYKIDNFQQLFNMLMVTSDKLSKNNIDFNLKQFENFNWLKNLSIININNKELKFRVPVKFSDLRQISLSTGICVGRVSSYGVNCQKGLIILLELINEFGEHQAMIEYDPKNKKVIQFSYKNKNLDNKEQLEEFLISIQEVYSHAI